MNMWVTFGYYIYNFAYRFWGPYRFPVFRAHLPKVLLQYCSGLQPFWPWLIWSWRIINKDQPGPFCPFNPHILVLLVLVQPHLSSITRSFLLKISKWLCLKIDYPKIHWFIIMFLLKDTLVSQNRCTNTIIQSSWMTMTQSWNISNWLLVLTILNLEKY